jgi:hypothetical protein
MSFESFRISCSESTEWDSPLESLADWGRRSWTDRYTGAIYVPQLFGQRHRLGLQNRTRGTGLPRRGWAQVLLASGQGTLTAYFTCHIQSLILHSPFFFLPSSKTCYVLDYFSSILGSTRPYIKWALRGSSPRYSRRGMKPTTRLDTVPKLKMCRAVPPLTHKSLWHTQEQLYVLRCFLCCSVMFLPYFHSCHFHFPLFSLSHLLTHYVSTNLTHHLHCLPCGLSRLFPYLLLLRATPHRGQTHYF